MDAPSPVSDRPLLAAGDLAEPVAVPFVLSAVVSVVLATYVARVGSPREDRVSRWLVVLLSGAGWWSACYVGRLVSTGDATLVWLTAEYVGSGVVPVAWLVVAAAYAGRPELVSTERVAALLAVPALVLVLVATNETHGVLWTVAGSAAVGDASVLVREFHPAFVAYIVYAYALIFAGAGLLYRAFRSSAGPYRGQIAALGGMVVAPIAGNLGFFGSVGGLGRVEFTAAGFTVTGALLVVSLFRYRAVDLTPVGRAAAVETMADAVAVVDGDRRVVTLNPAARRLFGVETTPLGRPLPDVAPFDAAALDPLFAPVERGEALALRSPGGDARHFDVRATPLPDSAGWTLIFHETTALRERNRELRRQNERLETFARIVSHDLRNPLNVAQGRLRLARERRDDDHLATVADAHERMGELVDDLLTLAREGEGLDEPGPVRLAGVAERAWRTVDTPAATLVVDTDLVVRADEGRLRQLLENLFRNAVEHGGSDGRDAGDAGAAVTVTVGDCEDGFYVADDGAGIPESVREDLFRSGVSTDREGTGLGLHIVDQVAAAHGWSVSAEEAADGGARFVVGGVERLPEAAVE